MENVRSPTSKLQLTDRSFYISASFYDFDIHNAERSILLKSLCHPLNESLFNASASTKLTHVNIQKRMLRVSLMTFVFYLNDIDTRKLYI